ncbi:MAG: hypothetical protein ACPLRA_02195, partial [Candidatus Saccharicenans sp.]
MKKQRILFLINFFTSFLILFFIAALSLILAEEKSSQEEKGKKAFEFGAIKLYWSAQYRLRYEFEDHYNLKSYGLESQ